MSRDCKAEKILRCKAARQGAKELREKDTRQQAGLSLQCENERLAKMS